MRWAFQIGRIGGTTVRVHLSFLLFLGWIAFLYGQLEGARAALEGVILVSLIFLCVLLHEFGHVFAAKHFGICTPEIILLPIGGVARLERMPEKPAEEILVAIAGPAVNLGIAGILWGWIELSGGFPDSLLQAGLVAQLPIRLLGINLWLILFNLIPAFPMDGGRVLRALLAMFTNYARATQIAASIGQAIAIGFGILGLFSNPMLILVGLFVYFAASAEASMAAFKSFSTGKEVSSAMITQFVCLPLQSTLSQILDLFQHSFQAQFPVVDECGEFRGLLTRDDVLVALGRSGPQTPVSEVMRTGIPTIPQTMLFDQAFALMQEARHPALPVLDAEGRIIGLFTPDGVGQLMLIQRALDRLPDMPVSPVPVPTSNP